MAKETKKPAVDFTEPLPEGLEIVPGRESAGFVPAIRTSGALVASGTTALDMDGVRPPYIQLAHATSTTIDMNVFNAGDIVLAKDFLAAKKGEKMQVIMLNVEKYMKEVISEEQRLDGYAPKTFPNREACIAAGYNMEWNDAKGLKPAFTVAFDMVLLIRKPEGSACGLYGIPIGVLDEKGNETEWALCRASFDKGNGRTMNSDITMVINGKLKQTGVYSAVWEFYSEITQNPNAKYHPFVVRARFKGMLDPVVVENIRNAMSVPVSVRDESEE